MEVELPDVPLSASWSYNGSLFAVSCKDRKLRIIDPRVGSIIRVGISLTATCFECCKSWTQFKINHVYRVHTVMENDMSYTKQSCEI